MRFFLGSLLKPKFVSWHMRALQSGTGPTYLQVFVFSIPLWTELVFGVTTIHRFTFWLWQAYRTSKAYWNRLAILFHFYKMSILVVDLAKLNSYYSCTIDWSCVAINDLLQVPRSVFFHSIIIILHQVYQTLCAWLYFTSLIVHKCCEFCCPHEG